MKFFTTALLYLASLLLFILPFRISAQNDGLSGTTIVIEDFESDKTGLLPAGWYERDGEIKLLNLSKKIQDEFKYKVKEEDGNKFLKYEGTRAKHINFPLADKEYIDIYETPILTWKTRAWKLPQNANEDSENRNDAVMSIYVVFDFGRVALVKKVPKSIRYTWSSTLEKGTESSKLFGNQQIVVVESGEDKLGEWVTFERNIVEDYRKLFGDNPPKKPLAILILSDGDSTGSITEADFDDILLKKKKDTQSNTN